MSTSNHSKVSGIYFYGDAYLFICAREHLINYVATIPIATLYLPSSSLEVGDNDDDDNSSSSSQLLVSMMSHTKHNIGEDIH